MPAYDEIAHFGIQCSSAEINDSAASLGDSQSVTDDPSRKGACPVR